MKTLFVVGCVICLIICLRLLIHRRKQRLDILVILLASLTLPTELTREIPNSGENIQADFNKAVKEMFDTLKNNGCRIIKGMAYTTDEKPGVVIITMKCVDEK